jgi:hypothetical protein
MEKQLSLIRLPKAKRPPAKHRAITLYLPTDLIDKGRLFAQTFHNTCLSDLIEQFLKRETQRRGKPKFPAKK